jgi:hypothetical protein
VRDEVQEGTGTLYVTVDGEAQPGTATSRTVLATGERVDQKIVGIAYRSRRTTFFSSPLAVPERMLI